MCTSINLIKKENVDKWKMQQNLSISHDKTLGFVTYLLFWVINKKKSHSKTNCKKNPIQKPISSPS